MFLLHPLHLLALEARRPVFPVPDETVEAKRAASAAASFLSLAMAFFLPRKAKASPQAVP